MARHSARPWSPRVHRPGLRALADFVVRRTIRRDVSVHGNHYLSRSLDRGQGGAAHAVARRHGTAAVRSIAPSTFSRIDSSPKPLDCYYWVVSASLRRQRAPVRHALFSTEHVRAPLSATRSATHRAQLLSPVLFSDGREARRTVCPSPAPSDGSVLCPSRRSPRAGGSCACSRAHSSVIESVLLRRGAPVEAAKVPARGHDGAWRRWPSRLSAASSDCGRFTSGCRCPPVTHSAQGFSRAGARPGGVGSSPLRRSPLWPLRPRTHCGHAGG